MLNKFSILILLLSTAIAQDDSIPQKTRGLLYPRESETREVRSLDGIWNFVKSDINDPMVGVQDGWYKDYLSKSRPTIPMPVPASYNDITTAHTLRDHVGTVWYERDFFIPHSWASNHRVWLRFSSVHYSAVVWVNGKNLTEHEIGHLPFEVEITDYANYGVKNRLTVLCDNSLTKTTIPQGNIVTDSSGNDTILLQEYDFDFFNYAGIHRSVHLYTTPKVFIEDIVITTDYDADETGYINYKVTSNSEKVDQLYIEIQLRDKYGTLVNNQLLSSYGLKGQVKVPQAQLWWPYLMHSEPGYLYTLEFYLHAVEDKTLLDVYHLKVGIRTLQWTNTSMLLNGKPIYLRGLGRHEDSDIHGKGLDLALLTRDFNLLKWIGANAYRTTHYPYSEESMQFADEYGIMIIDECSSVNTDGFTDTLLLNHKSSLEQLIHRDRNHPSVIMWSIANEPVTRTKKSGVYFESVVNYTRSLDNTRPITAAIAVSLSEDKAAKHLDVISFNRYNGWYSNPGRLDMITQPVVDEATSWNTKYNKPIIMSEYGADTLEGLHLLPSYIWSEDYQTELFARHFKAFDILRKREWFIGEFVWNFADFKTAQSYTRVGGNKKGVFTRSRQPKASAHLLRKRYFLVCQEVDQCSIPDDLFTYISDGSSKSKRDVADL